MWFGCVYECMYACARSYIGRCILFKRSMLILKSHRNTFAVTAVALAHWSWKLNVNVCISMLVFCSVISSWSRLQKSSKLNNRLYILHKIMKFVTHVCECVAFCIAFYTGVFHFWCELPKKKIFSSLFMFLSFWPTTYHSIQLDDFWLFGLRVIDCCIG